MSTTRHYVDNKKLFAAIVEYRKMLKKAKGDVRPPVPEYIGECILKIATRLSHKPNFASYSFREDMISDAIENVLLYLHNFDPEKSKNPFAYFTQICHYAFIRRINREKQHVYTKYKYAAHRAQSQMDYSTQDGSDAELKPPSWLHYENVHEFIRDFEARLDKHRDGAAARRPKREMPPLDLLDEEDMLESVEVDEESDTLMDNPLDYEETDDDTSDEEL